MLTKFSNRFPKVIQYFEGYSKKQDAIKLAEIAVINKVARDLSSFETITYQPTHPLFEISKNLKPYYDISFSRLNTLKNINGQIEKEIAKHTVEYEVTLAQTDPLIEAQNKPIIETQYRLNLTKQYLATLEKLLQTNEISEEKVFSRLNYITECCLLGTSSERIQLHLLLYGDRFDQEILQTSLYALYNTEIDVVVNLFEKYPGITKRIQKSLTKNSNSYLLDKLELNTKTRCILAWSDPNYEGFKPLPDDHSLSSEEVIKGRQLYFKEGKHVGKSFVNAIREDIENFYEGKRDNREILRRGILFMLVTGIFDWTIGSS